MPSKEGICFVSHNRNKLVEISHLAPEGFNFYGLDDLGVTDEIPETGTTIQENAIIKASHIHEKFQVACFADDTGLEIEALNGAPGVYSARYAGPEKDPVKNMDLVLNNLKDTTDRIAQFKTVIAYIDKSGKTKSFEGIVKGIILDEPKGKGGFGYDPIFIPDGYNETFAEMSLTQKNEISHRAIAFRKFFSFLTSGDE